MPLTAEQSYALGTKEGRNRINQQLRANPQYMAFLRSIGVNTSGPLRLSDQQRKQAANWVRQNMGDIGGLEIDPAGNLNNPQGFGTVAKQWGPVAAGAGVVAAPFVLPALGIGGGGGAGAAGAGAAGAGGVLPAASIPGWAEAGMYGPAAIASQGASAAVPVAGAGAGAAGAANAVSRGSQAADAASGGAASFLKKLATPENGAALAALIAGLMSQGSNGQTTDEIRRIQAINEARMRRVDPLHQVATNLAFGRLPVNYRQGVELNNVPLPG